MDRLIQFAIALFLLSLFLQNIGDVETPQVGDIEIFPSQSE